MASLKDFLEEQKFSEEFCTTLGDVEEIMAVASTAIGYVDTAIKAGKWFGERLRLWDSDPDPMNKVNWDAYWNHIFCEYVAYRDCEPDLHSPVLMASRLSVHQAFDFDNSSNTCGGER